MYDTGDGAPANADADHNGHVVDEVLGELERGVERVDPDGHLVRPGHRHRRSVASGGQNTLHQAHIEILDDETLVRPAGRSTDRRRGRSASRRVFLADNGDRGPVVSQRAAQHAVGREVSAGQRVLDAGQRLSLALHRQLAAVADVADATPGNRGRVDGARQERRNVDRPGRRAPGQLRCCHRGGHEQHQHQQHRHAQPRQQRPADAGLAPPTRLRARASSGHTGRGRVLFRAPPPLLLLPMPMLVLPMLVRLLVLLSLAQRPQTLSPICCRCRRQ